MIARVLPRRSGTRDRLLGLLEYLAGPGRQNEHTNQRIVAGWLSDVTNVDITDDAELVPLAGEMQVAAQYYETSAPKAKGGNFVYHVAVSLREDEAALADEQWAYVARNLARKLGFTATEDRAAVRWVAVHHGKSAAGNDHIHFVAYLAREDGSQVDMWNDFKKLGEFRQEMEVDPTLGLRVRTQHKVAGRNGNSRAELERRDRSAETETDREFLARTIRESVAGASCEAEWVRAMRKAGIAVVPRFDKDDPHSVVGYRVARKTDDTRVWFGGGKLAKDLSLPAIRNRWDGHDPAHAVAAWSRKAGKARVEPTIHDAARHARSEHEFVTLLRGANLVVIPRSARRSTETSDDEFTGEDVYGYLVAEAPQEGVVNRPVWFKDTDFDHGVLAQLRQRWGSPRDRLRTATVWGRSTSTPHIEQLLAGAAQIAPTETDWLRSVREQGLRIRPSRDVNGRIIGYRVGLEVGDTDHPQPMWWSSQRLSPTLALDALRQRWPAEPTATVRRAWANKTAAPLEPGAARQLAGTLSRFTSHVSTLTPQDVFASATAARESGEILAALAARMPAGAAKIATCRAVDSLTRAAELPNGSRRGLSSARELRGAARMIGSARITQQGGVQAWGHLLVQMMRVTDQLAGVHAATDRAAAAQHATAAAAHQLAAHRAAENAVASSPPPSLVAALNSRARPTAQPAYPRKPTPRWAKPRRDENER